MKTGNQWSLYVVSTVCFWVMLLWGLYGGSHGALLVACFAVWLFAVLSFCYLIPSVREASGKQKRVVPLGLVVALDCVAIVLLVFHGYIATGTALSFTVLMYSSLGYSRNAS